MKGSKGKNLSKSHNAFLTLTAFIFTPLIMSLMAEYFLFNYDNHKRYTMNDMDPENFT